MDIKDPIIYRNPEHQELFRDTAHLMGCARGDREPNDASCGGCLTGLTIKYEFEGSLWYYFLIFCLVSNENAYTTTREAIGPAGGSLDELAREDYCILKVLFNYDIRNLEPSGLWALMEDYKLARKDSRVLNRRVRNRIVSLAVQLEEPADAGQFQDRMVEFYREFSVGEFGLNKAFRVVEEEEDQPVIIGPIINVEYVSFKDVAGYKLRKQKLAENTGAFMDGKEVNNVLLFEDAGIGKSSSVRAVPNEYYTKGPRIIEAYKHQLKALSDTLGQIKDRDYKLIIYMDDLSSEDYELEYKYLKAILEGRLGKRPSNVSVYITPNRRHLICEEFNDKRELDDKLRNNDTVQERLPLAARFGVTIYYDSSGKRQFETVIKTPADRHDFGMLGQKLFTETDKWELNHGGPLGRMTAQFITHLRARRQVIYVPALHKFCIVFIAFRCMIRGGRL